jgi:predicted TIM-barrel fold metal-dependent hydrolase
MWQHFMNRIRTQEWRYLMDSNGIAYEARSIRASLPHPIVDADGHILESLPLLMSHAERLYGASAVEAFRLENASHPVRTMGSRERGEPRSSWWPTGNDALDQVTCTAPKLFAERMEEMGVDYAIMYPSFGLRLLTTRDDTVRRQMVRAENTMLADLSRDVANKMTLVAAVPMHTPEEAVEELHHIVQELGLKAVTMPPAVARPLPDLPDAFPAARLVDRYGIDSEYDYSPVWQTCVDLGVAVTFHGGKGYLYMPDGQESYTNFAANHILAHAYLQTQTLKSLLFAGVPRRFPRLRFAFMEGGAGWACDLLHHFEEHWEKRNAEGLKLLDPRLMDQDLYNRLLEKYGMPVPPRTADGLAWRAGTFQMSQTAPEAPVDAEWIRDEFAGTLIDGEDDIRGMFEDQFFFGCEADDRSVYRATDARGNAMNARLQPLFSSDAGHFDLPDLRAAVPSSHKLVERGLIDEAIYHDFVFGNVVRMYGAMNPGFFTGTTVETEAQGVLGTLRTARATHG